MDQSQKNRIGALTGIRFVAALGVFVEHILGKLGVVHLHGPFGDGGVTFFFVLSGFILTYVYADRLTSYRDLPRFYFTRWARIWPLHLVTLVIYILCFMKLAHIYNHAAPTQKLIANVLLLHSWVPNYGWCFSYNGVSWSISTEAFFYLMFPLLILNRRWFWGKYFFASVVIAAYVGVVFVKSDAINQSHWASVLPLMHCFPLVRLFEFMTGMAVARLFLALPRLLTERRYLWKDSLIEIGAIGLLLAYYFYQFYFPRTSQWPQMFYVLSAKIGPVFFYAILIFFFSYTRGIIGRFMGSRIMVYLGEISFAFYMIHLILIKLMQGYHFQPLPMYHGGVMVAALLISIAAASLLYHVVEVPAKASLLSLYDHGLISMAGEMVRRTRTAFQSTVVWAAIVVVAATILVLQNWSLERLEDPGAVEIIQKTELFEQPIHFGNEAVLFGLTSRVEAGLVEVDLAWVKKRSGVRERLVEVFSNDDRPRKNIRQSIGNYANAPVGKLFVEKITIAKQKFENGDRLCIGFFSQAEKMPFVSGGPRSFYNRRLDIFTNEDEN